MPPDRPLDILTPADIYATAERVLGRRPDVRDRRSLHAAAKRPLLAAFGAEAYPTVIDKAAALLHALTTFHIFYDGNKRTATAATARFLRQNGLRPIWTEDEVQGFVLAVAQNRHDVAAVADWLAQHTQEAPT